MALIRETVTCKTAVSIQTIYHAKYSYGLSTTNVEKLFTKFGR